jgi:hypothetical protein
MIPDYGPRHILGCLLLLFLAGLLLGLAIGLILAATR